MIPKKIVFISHSLGNGGAERASSIIASGLSRIGYEVTFIAVYNDKVTYELEEHIRYIYLNVQKNSKITRYFARVKKIREIISSINPDLIISFITQEVLPISIWGKYKIIYSERTNPSAKSFLLRVITNFAYRLSYRVVFQTNGAKSYFGNAIRRKSVVIANPIISNLPFWNMEEHENAIVTVGRITPEKNQKMLIKAFAIFLKRHPDYVLKIYGEPRYKEAKDELVSLVKELEIEKYVFFPGFSGDIHNLMSNSAIFALTSNYEGLSNSMLEALCIGIPTICTDCPSYGAREFITNGLNGFLVDVDDSISLSNRMCEIADSRELQKRFYEHTKSIRERTSIETIISQWRNLIKA